MRLASLSEPGARTTRNDPVAALVGERLQQALLRIQQIVGERHIVTDAGGVEERSRVLIPASVARAVWWSHWGASFQTMTDAIAGAGQSPTTPVFGDSTLRHEHDVVTTNDPFVAPLMLGANHLTRITEAKAPALAPGGSVKGAGVGSRTWTEGHAGAAPDIGGIIEGRPTPQWGAKP